MNSRVLFAVAALAVQPALAGPYDQPWAVVEAGSKSDVRKEAPVAITKIDGASARNPRKSDPIAPGPHKVSVRFETARSVAPDNTRELDMALEACTRYRVVAVYQSATRPEWEPKIYPEPIVECARKFSKGGAK